jgi:hypothetical protein
MLYLVIAMRIVRSFATTHGASHVLFSRVFKVGPLFMMQLLALAWRSEILL